MAASGLLICLLDVYTAWQNITLYSAREQGITHVRPARFQPGSRLR